MGIQERKAREFERREEEILSAALALFAGDDWQAVTVEAIAAQAEIGKGTIYKHFASKDEIYGRLANRFSLRLLAQAEAIDAGDDARSRLQALISIVWKGHLALSPAYRRVVQYCERRDFIRRLGPVLQQETREILDRFGRLVQGLFRAGIAQGYFADREADQLVFATHAALIGGVRLLWNGDYNDGPEAEDGRLRELTRFIESGLGFPAESA